MIVGRPEEISNFSIGGPKGCLFKQQLECGKQLKGLDAGVAEIPFAHLQSFMQERRIFSGLGRFLGVKGTF